MHSPKRLKNGRRRLSPNTRPASTTSYLPNESIGAGSAQLIMPLGFVTSPSSSTASAFGQSTDCLTQEQIAAARKYQYEFDRRRIEHNIIAECQNDPDILAAFMHTARPVVCRDYIYWP